MHIKSKISTRLLTKIKVEYVTYENDSNRIIKGYDVLINDTFIIQKVIYVTCLKHNLINVAMLNDAEFKVEFD